MQLTGKLDRDDERIVQEFLVPLSIKLGYELKTLKGLVGQVAMQLQNDLSAVGASFFSVQPG